MNNNILDFNKVVQKGEIYYARLIGENSMQNGIRPVVIFQNSMAGRYSSNCTVIPLTSKGKRMLPTHTIIKSCLRKESIALTENIITISKSMLEAYIGKCTDQEINNIEKCLMIQLGIIVEYHSQNQINTM